MIDAVSGTNANCKRSAVSASDKLLSLVWISVGVLALNSWAVVLFAANFAKLCLNRKVDRASKLGDRCGKGNIVLKRNVRAVNHDGSVTSASCLNAAVKAVTVIKMKSNRNSCLFSSTTDHCCKVIKACVLDGARSGLKNNRGAALFCCLNNSHYKLKVLNVKGANSIMASLCVKKHLLSSNEHLLLLSPLWAL